MTTAISFPPAPPALPALKDGDRRIFAYPEAFTTLPDHTAHAGQIVTVLRHLTDEEYDNEGDPMYAVRADDGWEGHAWESELEPITLDHAADLFRQAPSDVTALDLLRAGSDYWQDDMIEDGTFVVDVLSPVTEFLRAQAGRKGQLG